MTRCKDGRLLRPFLDWSFKYLFGTPENKPNLIAFLNLMLMPESPIVDVEFMNNESLPESEEMKECIFDLICKDKNGEQYLIEVQNRPIENMRERIIYYTCRLVDRMGRRGSEWDYQDIKKVYSICIMNFNYEKDPVLRRDIQLCDVNTRKIFSDKLNIILIQMPCMRGMKIGECNKYYEYLLYLLQQMHDGMKTIDELKREVADTKLPQGTKELFYKVLDTAEVASLSEEEQMKYESNLKNYMDTMGCIRFARKEGTAEGFGLGFDKGVEKGEIIGRNAEKVEIAKSMKADGMDSKFISKHTGLPVEEIEKL